MPCQDFPCIITHTWSQTAIKRNNLAKKPHRGWYLLSFWCCLSLRPAEQSFPGTPRKALCLPHPQVQNTCWDTDKLHTGSTIKVNKSWPGTWLLEKPWTSLAAVKGVHTGLVFVIREPKMRQSEEWRNKFGHYLSLAETVWEKKSTSELLQRQKAKGPTSQLGSSCWGFHITQL